MALALSAATQQAIGTATYNKHAGSNRLLVAVAQATNAYATSVSLGGVAFTKFGSDAPFYDNAGGIDQRLNVWYLLEAGIASAPTNGFGATGMTQGGFSIFEFTGADQTTPINDVVFNGLANSGAGSPLSMVMAASAVGDIICSGVGCASWTLSGTRLFDGTATASELLNVGAAYYKSVTVDNATYDQSFVGFSGSAIGIAAISVAGGGHVPGTGYGGARKRRRTVHY